MKKRWLVALLVGVLALSITGGAVLAQDNGTGTDTPLKSFASRVATILGLEETQVQDALKQAATEMQDEALQRKLDKLVEKEKLTQEQADDYKEWYDSRPEGMFPGKQAATEMQDEALQRKLDKLVEKGKLTQEQADAYKQWYLARPEGGFPGLPGMMKGHGFGGMMGGRGGHGMGGGMMGGRGDDHGMGFWGQVPPTPTPQSSGTTGL